MSGSISAYKVCALISSLTKKNYQVQVVATPSTFQFVGQSTLEGISGNPVLSDTFEPGHSMSHIHLVRDTDLVIVAPATANFINKMAQGLGDDLASSLTLAFDFKKPFLLAPAMNTSMLNHPATQSSLAKLKSWGIQVLSTGSGALACGEVGEGRLLEVEQIENHIVEALTPPLKSKKILITAGGTQEKIDQVRVIGNLSTGKTGTALAKTFLETGAAVTLLLARNHQALVPEHPRLTLKYFTDFYSLQSLLNKELSEEFYDGMIHTAAVSDYSVESVTGPDEDQLNRMEKISSSNQKIQITLKKNKKLIDDVKNISKNKNIQLVGFKLTSETDKNKILKKVQSLFQESHCDFVVQNDISNLYQTTRFNLFGKNFTESFKDPQSLGAKIIKSFEGELL